ncbi:hypothetical protein BDV10DRAFT_189791 [Aspergillus recurvatus]
MPDLEALNASLDPLLNLTQFIPPGTPSSLRPQLEPRLAAIESFTAGYRDLVNAFGATNCAATLDTAALTTRLHSRQTQPDPLVIICSILDFVQHLLQPLVETLDELIIFGGCHWMSG